MPQITLEKQIEVACLMAADSVTKLGTQISFPDRIYMQTCLKEHNVL